MTRKEKDYWLKMLREQLKAENEAIEASMPGSKRRQKTSFGSISGRKK